jgi:molybdopterin-guanine dinucleotide biosynthesis protein A
MEIEGFILAGGASSRMGEDKSRLSLGGRTFVESAADALGAVAPRVSVVSSRPEAGAHGLPLVPDLRAGLGALGGLQAAFGACRAEWAAVVACDLPFVTGELLARLASLRSGDVDAVVPTQEDGRVQPLCALYRAGACLARVEEMIRAGELRPRMLLPLARARRVGFDELRDLAGSSRLFLNVNTPEDYARALGEGGAG